MCDQDHFQEDLKKYSRRDVGALAAAVSLAAMLPRAAHAVDVKESDIALAYQAAYAGSPFIRLTGSELPEVKHVAHTNFCDIGWRINQPARQLVLVVCLDNLVKGAAGQAVQNFNVAFGFDERLGLN